MRGAAFLAVVLAAGSALGGQIIVEGGLDPLPPVTGQVNFSGDDWVRFPGWATDGRWLAGVELLGTAERLDVITFDPTVGVASVPPAGPVSEDGWTSYDVRAFDLFVSTNSQHAVFINGHQGMFLGIHDGHFTKVQGYDSPASPSNALLFSDTGPPTNAGAIVIARFLFEIPDAPYGDTNADGRIDLTDFGILKANFGTRNRSHPVDQ